MLRLATAAFTASVAALAGCGGGMATRSGPLPPYDGHAMQLFDDAIEPTAVGYELGSAPPPMNDAHLRERAQVGDAVVRARVTTVTSKNEDGRRTWQLGFHTIERLGGSGLLSNDFTVRVEPNGPAAGIMRAFGGRLVGMMFIAFVREFAHPAAQGESVLHFHAAQDEKAYVAAVHSAFTLHQVH